MKLVPFEMSAIFAWVFSKGGGCVVLQCSLYGFERFTGVFIMVVQGLLRMFRTSFGFGVWVGFLGVRV